MIIRQFVMMGMSVVGMLIITRVLGPEKYGPYAAALGIYMFLVSLLQMGVEVYLIRSSEALAERVYHAASTLLLAISVIGVVGVELSTRLIGSWVRVAGFENMLRILILVLPIQALASAASAQLEKTLDFKRVAMIDASAQMLYHLLVVMLVFSVNLGSWALVVGWICQQSTASLAYHVAAGYRPRLILDWPVFRRILGYTLGYSSAASIYQLRLLINPLIVGHFLGSEGVATIGVGIKIVEILSIAKVIAWRLLVPALSRLQENKAKLVIAMTEGMQLQTLAIAPGLLAFSWFGDFLSPHLFGTHWHALMMIYPFLAVSYLTNAQFNLHSSVLYVRQRNWDVALFHVMHIALFAGGSWVGVRSLGLLGYGWGEVAGIGSYAIIHRQISREVGSPFYGLSALWWLAVVVGLFWQSLGSWAIAIPIVTILLPQSVRQLMKYALWSFEKPSERR